MPIAMPVTTFILANGPARRGRQAMTRGIVDPRKKVVPTKCPGHVELPQQDGIGRWVSPPMSREVTASHATTPTSTPSVSTPAKS